MRGLDEPWAQTVESFLYACHELKDSTRKGYGKCLRRLPCKTLADFTLMTVNRHVAEKLAAGHQTIAHHDGIAAVQIGKWLVSIGVFDRSPMQGLRVPKQPVNRRQPFNDVDVDRILEAAAKSQQSERDVTIMLLALACGLRKGEILTLQTDDVHLGKCNCLGTKKPHLIVRQGKTDAASRRVPVSASVVHALDTYIKDWRPSKDDGALFLNNHGDEFSEDGWSSVFRRIRGRLPRSLDFKLHRARNTALTNWHRAGVDIRTLGYLAGHSRIEHTERYLGAITPAQIDAVPDAFARVRKAS